MSIIGQLVLFGCLPAVLLVFASTNPTRAFIISLMLAWLFLPCGGYTVQGLPDFGKPNALALSLFLGVFLFNSGALFSFRPRWYDLPMLVFCVSTTASDLAFGDDLHTSITDSILAISVWGIPYLLARATLTEWKDLNELVKWLLLGGLIYLPLCLYESKMSPVFSNQIYGFCPQLIFHSPRMGLGYRPIVFMSNGLEVGLFMTMVALVAWSQWLFVSAPLFRRITTGAVVALTVFGAIMTKSVGAWQMGAMTLALIWVVKRTHMTLLILLLALIAPTYELVRTMDWWTGESLVTFNRTYFGEERAESLDFRLKNERILIDKALQRPWLGWGGSGRSRVFNDAGGDVSVTDGYWVIVLGMQGIVGLVAMNLAMLLPAVLYVWRSRSNKRWLLPEPSMVAALSVVLILFMLDGLSNAFPSPIYAVICGVTLNLLGRGTLPRTTGEAQLRREQAEAMEAAGELEAAEMLYREAAAEYSRCSRLEPAEPAHRLGIAACDDALATLYDRTARGDEAIALRLRQLALCEAVANENPRELAYREQLAAALGSLGRSFRAAGRIDDARDAWLRAMQVWETMEAATLYDAPLAARRAEAFNDAAWALGCHPDHRTDDLAYAVDLARQAVEFDRNSAVYWNTLGTAYFQAGQWDSAITSLQAACELSEGGTAYDQFLLAMAHQREGESETALAYYHQAVAWMHEHGEAQPDLERLREEAESTLLSGRFNQ